MNKIEFIESLKQKLSNLPKDELEERVNFYLEIIEDKIEEGIKEQEAIAQLGSVEEIANQIISDIPLRKLAKEKLKKQRKLQTWEIFLLVIGFPLWFSLLVAFLAIILALYISLWAIVISFMAIFIALALSSIALILLTGLYVLTSQGSTALMIFGLSLVCAGLSIMFFYLSKLMVKAMIKLAKKIMLAFKYMLIKKER